jgi:pimeloyl-ACP methyl ester carboxylesterase
MTAGTDVQDQFITLDGLRVHYREWGATEAPALVILHGAADYAQSWDPVARALADSFHVVVPDLRGHGETDWAADYSAPTFIADTEQLTQHLQLPPFALIGHSLGATVAYRYAARYPERVTRLVIGDIGPDVFSTPLLEATLAQFRATGLEVFDNPAEPLRRALTAPHPAAPVDEQAVRDRTAYNLIQGADGRWRWRYDAAGLGATLPVGSEVETADWAALAQLRCPTLVVRGEHSPVLSRENAERMVQATADCRWVEVPASSHGVNNDNLAGYLAVVTPFLLAQAG